MIGNGCHLKLSLYVGLNPFQQPVLAVIHKKEKILENFLNIIVECVLERGAPVFHSEFVHLKRPWDVLD